jgi:hypothetical protein
MKEDTIMIGLVKDNIENLRAIRKRVKHSRVGLVLLADVLVSVGTISFVLLGSDDNARAGNMWPECSGTGFSRGFCNNEDGSGFTMNKMQASGQITGDYFQGVSSSANPGAYLLGRLNALPEGCVKKFMFCSLAGMADQGSSCNGASVKAYVSLILTNPRLTFSEEAKFFNYNFGWDANNNTIRWFRCSANASLDCYPSGESATVLAIRQDGADVMWIKLDCNNPVGDGRLGAGITVLPDFQPATTSQMVDPNVYSLAGGPVTITDQITSTTTQGSWISGTSVPVHVNLYGPYPDRAHDADDPHTAGQVGSAVSVPSFTGSGQTNNVTFPNIGQGGYYYATMYLAKGEASPSGNVTVN